MGNVVMSVYYRWPNQHEVNEAFFRPQEESSGLQAQVLIRDLSHPNICWSDNTVGHKQSRRCLECVDD